VRRETIAVRESRSEVWQPWPISAMPQRSAEADPLQMERARSGSLRIGIDGRAFMRRPTGVGRYVVELCKHLDRLLPNARFFAYAPSELNLPFCSERWTARIDRSWAARNFNRGLWLISRAGSLCSRDCLDVFWGAVTLLPRLEPQVKAVTTVYDLNHKIVPSTMGASDLWGRRLLFGPSLARASQIVAISDGTAAKLRSVYGRTVAAVVRPGVSEEFTPQPREKVQACLSRYRLAAPYLLAVGTREPRKNFDILVEAYLEMKSEGLLDAHSLVLAGNRGWKDKRLRGLLEHGASRGVIVLDYVDQNVLPALYTGADALILPSFYEGFGIPVLEARACGAQVVASDIPELREAGGDDAIYIAPSRAGIREGILKVVSDGAGATVSADRPPTWEKGAEVLARVLTEGVGSDAR
jgi:glycosyltransferase involved in cell wall biosynthesis